MIVSLIMKVSFRLNQILVNIDLTAYNTTPAISIYVGVVFNLYSVRKRQH